MIDLFVEGWLRLGVPAVAIGLLARGLWTLAALGVVRRGIRAAGRAAGVAGPFKTDAPPDPAPAVAPPTVVILLPMLREQSVAVDAIRTMASLPYPGGRAVVCVITTEREEAAKAALRHRVAALDPDRLTPARLRGLFPAARAAATVAHVAGLPAVQRRDALLRRFDEEPTTVDVVRDLLAKWSANGDAETSPRLPVVHLHQPVQEGRKASQLNFAVANLDAVLGKADGGEWNAEETYLLVYDADALPDRRTLSAIADLVRRHKQTDGTRPGMIQQHRLPTRFRRPFPTGPAGLVLAAEWVLLVRRCLAIEWARLLLSERTARWRPGVLRTLVRPVVYAVGCGMAVRLPELRAIGGFPEPMEDVVGGFRLSLLGTSMIPLRLCVADEPYADLRSVVNLHSLVYSAYRRPARHLRAVAGVSRLRPAERAALVGKIRLDIAAWLVAAPMCVAAFASAVWLTPGWLPALVLGAVLWGQAPTVLVLSMRTSLSRAVHAPRDDGTTAPLRWTRAALVSLVVLSPLFQWIEMVGGWRMAALVAARRPVALGKTER